MQAFEQQYKQPSNEMEARIAVSKEIDRYLMVSLLHMNLEN